MMAACLLPYDPVAKRKTSKGGSDAHSTIAESTAEVSSTSTSGNLVIGEIGVHLRWHKAKKFEKLINAQRRELVQCRHSNNGKEGPPSKRQRFSRDDS